ncbi:BZ3500_MvSof-1268-A1-R1_Chr8-1g09736 [Microbotryum saponariae]|uniref:Riboflavin kinase n=1 Tax=Microbotryum saponariae TaxID=289078 RepID=A0A2X0NJ33_9BASI|nr:BZ3500_MvSof-1268-A1-R1_Chr8-1g09736 [Microbotryum saponariae]SDA08022.1 BZ3501_MvSof-1269-A2-R1_Chr8-1g09459 [Microbotryum saponariae]
MSAHPRTLHTRPTTPLQHDPSVERPEVTGAESGPESPFPVYLEGWVTRGFGRGSKDLGCPTANLPDSSIDPYATTLQTGVYYGYARVLDPPDHPQNSLEFSTSASSSSSSTPCPHDQVWPMVMSIGWNPFYKNRSRTAEVHILHDYPHDFYGKELRVVMLGFIRPEYNYSSMDALIKDINTDKEVSLRSVSRPAYTPFAQDPFFTRESRLEEPKEDPNKVREKPTMEEREKL